jgi:hypothetical protein
MSVNTKVLSAVKVDYMKALVSTLETMKSNIEAG